MANLVSLKPRLSEKAYGLSETRNTYVFDIPAGINRYELAAAVAQQFEVKVVSVRLAGVPGKSRRNYSRKTRSLKRGNSSDIRKAYVKLAAEDKLPLFDAVEESESKQKAEDK